MMTSILRHTGAARSGYAAMNCGLMWLVEISIHFLIWQCLAQPKVKDCSGALWKRLTSTISWCPPSAARWSGLFPSRSSELMTRSKKPAFLIWSRQICMNSQKDGLVQDCGHPLPTHWSYHSLALIMNNSVNELEHEHTNKQPKPSQWINASVKICIDRYIDHPTNIKFKRHLDDKLLHIKLHPCQSTIEIFISNKLDQDL